jgi:sulfite reductase (ferredoxin)
VPDDVITQKKLSGVETLKQGSIGLRGRLAEELAEGGIQVSEDAYNLLKFHGSYEQFDRDTATARKQQKVEKEYQFMVRVRIPGGVLDASRYLALDGIADSYANGTLRITTRQGIQFHGILKGDLKPSIAAINHGLMTTMSACGDVVRNLMATPAPRRDARHARVRADVEMLSQALLPKSRAYYQIFLDEQPVGGADEEETLYGATYLPRKFKIGIALPDDNSVDVLSNDLGVIAHFDDREQLEGYTIAVGGGLGMTHNQPRTFPRLATPVCFVRPDELLAICEAVIRLQRDHGDRGDRRRARLKYVVQDHGIDWVTQTLADYFGRTLTPPRPLPALDVPDLLGWHEQGDGLLWLGVPVLSGRIQDAGTMRLRTALRTIMQRFGVDPIFTAQQNVLLSNVRPADRASIDQLLREHGVTPAEAMTPLARFALACPALPTCGLALTEAERVQGPMVAMFEGLLAEYGLSQERISLRVTGCPNGCTRSYAGDIGLVGRVPGFYAIYVGGDFNGTRLSFQLFDKVAYAALGSKFAPLLQAFARDRVGTEGFGDFCDRLGRDALLGLAGESDSKAA